MVAVPLPTSSFPGQHPQESGGRIENGYPEPLGDSAGSPLVIRRVPGIASWGTSSQTGFRGMQLSVATLYAAYSGKVYKYTSAGGAAAGPVGNLAGTAKVFWARNNASTPDLVVVSPGDGAFVVTSSAVSAYPDADVGQPNAVCFHKGFFIFTYGTALMRASGVNVTSINTLDNATAETNSDTLYRPVPTPNGLLACGPNSIEVWAGINDTGFPFSYTGSVVSGTGGAIGLAGPYALAGHEDGFSGPIGFVGNDNAFHLMVNTFRTQKVSPPDLDALIQEVSDKSTIEVGAFMASGHVCYAVSCADWTWVFDANTQKWHERKSYQQDRWRGTQPHYAFGKWLTGDTDSGNIGSIEPSARAEFGDPLRMRVESGIPAFPPDTPVARLKVHVTTGVGIATGHDPDQTDPTIEVSSTINGGQSWSVPLLRKLGRQQIGNQIVEVNRPARTKQRGIRWRFDVSDGVHVGLMGADMTDKI